MVIGMYFIWISIAIIGIIIEINIAQQIGWAALFSSFVSIIIHAATGKIEIEIIAFFVMWIISWLILIAIVMKFRKKWHDEDDGYLSYIDKEYVTTKSNDKNFGELMINDKVFRFTSKDKIKEKDNVKVISIKGVTFIVEKVK